MCCRRFRRGSEQQGGEVHVGPSGPQSFAFDTSPASGRIFQSGQGDLTQDGEILSGMALANGGCVFAEGHIQAPVQIVFDGPVAAHRPGEALGVGADAAEAADRRLLPHRRLQDEPRGDVGNRCQCHGHLWQC
jgi:hypothetical protein